MGKDIEISTAIKGDAVVLSIKGDVNAVTGGFLEKAYGDNAVCNAGCVVLKFDKNTYINSGGLAFLINIASQGKKKEQKICVAGLSDHFQKIFHMIGLSRCLEIIDSEE